MGIMDIEDTQAIEGEGEAQEKIERFILNILESVELEGEYIFGLFQHGRGGEEDDPVFSSECEGSKKQEVRIARAKELSEEITEAAIEDVSNFLKGTHKYVVKCDNVRARCVFTLKVNQTEDDDMDDIEETPNKKGLLSQLMRHQEKIMKVAVGSVKNVIDMQSKAIRDKDDRIKALEDKQIETIRITEDLVSGQHARNMEIRKLEKKEKRMDEIAGVVMQGAPMLLQMVANSASKKEEGSSETREPQQAQSHQTSDSPIEAVAEMLMGTFTTEQLSKIQASGLFAPEQLLMIIKLAQAIDAKNQAKPQNGENEKE